MILKKYLPTLVCGFGAAVLSTVPGIKNFSCCLLVPGAAALSLLLDKKINKISDKFTLSKGLGFGFLTGLSATVFITFFEMLITMITKSNDFVEALPQSEIIMSQWNLGPLVKDSFKLLKDISKEIQVSGFSLLYMILVLSSNLIVNSIFGLIGGALGISFLNKKNREEN